MFVRSTANELRFQTIIFDFDFTLVDSSQGVYECINFALASLELPTVLPERTHPTIGLSLTEAFMTLTAQEHRHHTDELVRLFIRHADAIMVDNTVLLDVVPGVVDQLRSYGYRLGIVSTNLRYRIEAILRRERLLHAFDVIIGGEDVAKGKPDPEGIITVIQKLSSSRSRSLYAGDSTVDAETARRAGVPFIAVLSGTTPRSCFAAYKKCRILESLRDLPATLGCR